MILFFLEVVYSIVILFVVIAAAVALTGYVMRLIELIRNNMKDGD